MEDRTQIAAKFVRLRILILGAGVFWIQGICKFDWLWRKFDFVKQTHILSLSI